jgi:hypothetical protein
VTAQLKLFEDEATTIYGCYNPDTYPGMHYTDEGYEVVKAAMDPIPKPVMWTQDRIIREFLMNLEKMGYGIVKIHKSGEL